MYQSLKNARQMSLFSFDDAKVRNFSQTTKHFPNFFSFWAYFFHFLYKNCTFHTLLCKKNKIKCTFYTNFIPCTQNIIGICTHVRTYIAIKIQIMRFKAIFKPSDSLLQPSPITFTFHYLKMA